MRFLHTLALPKTIIILHQFLSLVRSINVGFLPCDADANATTVDCHDRPLRRVPFFKSTSVVSVDLSRTKILQVWQHAFAGVPNLHTLKIMGNCLPGKERDRSCKMKLHPYAFMNILKLQVLHLSGNGLTSIPRLPESLRVLDLQNNHIFNIIHPLNAPYLEELFLSKNCYYVNPCNQTFYISEQVFRQLPRLKNLTLGYNNLTAIPKGLPTSLENLDLRENAITEVLGGTFASLTALSYLNLEWNCQRCDHAARPCFPCPQNLPLRLHPNSFYAENSSIVYLSLRGNSLKTFPEGLFKPLKRLKRLDLSDNLLAYAIQNGTFFGEMKSLTWISLLYNYEPQRTFPELILSPHISSMSGLQYLLLSGNFFRTLSKQSIKVLSKLRQLTTLELRMNFMNAFNLTSIKQLPSLKYIDLSQNVLTFLPLCLSLPSEIGAQDGCRNQNSCANNVLDQPSILVDREASSGSDNWDSYQSNVMEMLEGDACHIPALQDFKTHYCQHELTFDMSQNDMLSLTKKVFLGMEDTVCLDLSFNYMSQALKGGVFEIMQNLVFLNLSYNRLDLYYKDAFYELKSTLKVLDVSNNDFHFKMKGMGHRFEFIRYLTSLEVLSLANNGIGMRIDQRLISGSLKYLYFSGNHLDIMWGSDNNWYTSFFQNLTKLIYLDISNNNLKTLSSEVLSSLPKSIKALKISSNLLNYFPWQNISALSNLCHLDLSQNFFFYLPHKTVQFGDKFSLLDLSHNRITFIPETFFGKTKSLRYLYLNHNQIKQLSHQHLPSPFKNGSTLQKLTLHSNPFKCDCDTSWFADYLRMTPVEIPFLTTHVHCEYPESQHGHSILFVDQRSCQDIYGSLACLVCSFLTVTFTVLPLMKHLYGWDMWYCLQVLWAGQKGYSQLPGTDSHHRYDAFVVFDTENQAVRDWVYKELIRELENSDHRKFSLCLEERDWIPGLSCIDNLHNAVHSSVKTVFVLSKGANGNETVNGVIRQAFFMVQQRLLDEKVDAAVLVLLDEMFPKLKYLQLRKRLCRKSVLSWPKNPRAQPLFWNQMRIALSSDNLKFYDDNMSESFI